MDFDDLKKEYDSVNALGISQLSKKEFSESAASFRTAAGLLYKMSQLTYGDIRNKLINEGNSLLQKSKQVDALGGNKGKESNKGGQAQNDGLTDFHAAKIPKLSFADIAGLENVKNEIYRKMIAPLNDLQLSKDLNLKLGGGLLLYGPPGTGKTMIAKAIAHEVDAVFYAVKASDIVSKYVGDSQRNIKLLFDKAKEHPRAIIFFDELDSMFMKRGIDKHNDDRVNELLQQMEGVTEQSGTLFFLGATNLPWNVDDAAKRPGRFSVQVHVPLPDDKARKYLIERSFSNIKLPCDLDADSLVESTEGYSGADINEIIQRAAQNAFLRITNGSGEKRILKEDIDKARSTTNRSVSESLKEMYAEYERKTANNRG